MLIASSRRLFSDLAVQSARVGLLVLLCCFTRVAAIAQDDSTTFNRAQFAGLPDEQVVLLEEFFAAYKGLKAFYQNAAISARETDFRAPLQKDGLPIPVPVADLVVRVVREGEYRSREGKYFRLDGEIRYPNEPALPREVLTGIIRPEESFLLGRDQGDGKYYLKGHGKSRDEYLGELYSYLFPVAPFASLGGMLLEYEVFTPLSDKTIVSVEVAGDLDEVIATVVIRYASDKGTVVRRIQLLRNRHWAVKRIDDESHTNTDQGEVLGRNLQECDYEGEISGFPVLKRIFRETRAGYVRDGEPVLRVRNIIDVSTVTAGPSDLSVFDVGKLVPKFDRVGEITSPSRIRWLLIINGVILLIIGIFISRKKWRSAA
jgi:hypothetical protein